LKNAKDLSWLITRGISRKQVLKEIQIARSGCQELKTALHADLFFLYLFVAKVPVNADCNVGRT
jgi:hypothetical protein